MEDYIEYQKYISSIDNVNSAYQACEFQLLKTKGIYKVLRADNTLTVGYNIYEISKTNLTALMDELGLRPIQSTSKGILTKWLDKIAKTNQESFNSKRLDCCDLNN